MPDIHIKIGNRILTRAQFLVMRETGTPLTTFKEALPYAHNPAPHHCGKTAPPPAKDVVVATHILECRRSYVMSLRKDILTHLLRSRYEYSTTRELLEAITKSGLKCSRAGLELELSYIKHALEPQGVFNVAVKPDQHNRQVMAYKYTGTIKDSDIPGLVEQYLPEIAKSCQVVKAMKLEQRSLKGAAQVKQNIHVNQTPLPDGPGDVTQTIRLKVLVDVHFSVKLQED